MSCGSSQVQCLPPKATLLFFQGITGAVGATGPLGPTGPQGTPGTPGGATGPTGPRGYDGIVGPTGVVGPTGAVGSSGPLCVFRGTYDITTRYYYNASRRDVVLYNSTFWLANSPAKDAQIGWGTPGSSSDWVSFGSTFSMIATGLLLTENAIITVSLTLGSTGSSAGYIQSANYVPGTSGFVIRASGYAEFNDVLIRGAISTTSYKFNSANTTNTMPTIGYAQNVFTEVPDVDIPENPALYYGTDNSLIFFGWNRPTTTTGYAVNRFGSTTQPFLINLQGNATNTSAGSQYLYCNLAYRVRTNGGAWGAWSAATGADFYAPKDAPSFTKLDFIVLTLAGNQDVQFGAVWSKGTGGTVKVDGAVLSVQAFN